MVSTKSLTKIFDMYSSKGLDEPFVIEIDSPGSFKSMYNVLMSYFYMQHVNIAEQIVSPPTHFFSKRDLMHGLDLTTNLIWDFSVSPEQLEIARKSIWELLKENSQHDWDSYSEESKNYARERVWKKILRSKVYMFEYDKDSYKYYFGNDIEYFFGMFYETVCILCKTPIYEYRDEENRLHSIDGKSLEFNDGTGVYFVNGVHFEEPLFNEIYIDKSITPKKIVGLANAEQRACAVHFYGYQNLTSELGAVLLDEWEGISRITNKPVKCQLFEFEIDSWRDFRFVTVEDHTTHKVTTLGVDVIPDTETVWGAIAWTFGLTYEEYELMYES